MFTGKIYKFIIKNEQFISGNIVYKSGFANGYVALPPNHIWYNKPYDDIPVHAHGGLTFSSTKKHCWDEKSDDLIEIDCNYDEIPDDFYVIGFDTRHYNDNLNNCSKEYVIEEVEYLYFQCVFEKLPAF